MREFLLAKFDVLVMDEADIVLEPEGPVVLVDLDVEDVHAHLAVAVVANVVLTEDKLQFNSKSTGWLR